MDNATARHNCPRGARERGVPLSPYYTIWHAGARKQPIQQQIQQQINNQYNNKYTTMVATNTTTKVATRHNLWYDLALDCR